jgi:hypothetical protein
VLPAWIILLLLVEVAVVEQLLAFQVALAVLVVLELVLRSRLLMVSLMLLLLALVAAVVTVQWVLMVEILYFQQLHQPEAVAVLVLPPL